MKVLAADKIPSLLAGKPPWTDRKVVFKNMAEEAGYLRTVVQAGIANMAVRELATSIVIPRARAKAEFDQAIAIGTWVQDNIYYVHEGVETFEAPETTLRLKSGDCDAMTVLVLSLLGCIGIRGKMCILKLTPKGAPKSAARWAHIFPVAFCKQDGTMHRVTLDATLDQPIRDLVNPIAMCKARGDTVETLFA